MTSPAIPPQRGRSGDSGVHGLLVVDKPPGVTSHDVVARIRSVAGTRRVGHTGTLDPMATGVLVLCLGQATRLIPYLEEGGADAKEYEAGIRFGFETTTDDAEGEPLGPAVATDGLTREGLTAGLSGLVGETLQVPPAFSAKKVAGKRAYALARRGEAVELKAVAVRVGAAELLAWDGTVARVRFACSRGAYVRALARDLGRTLGPGAHLVALRRLRSGRFALDRAISLEGLTPESVAPSLLPLVEVLDWPLLGLDDREVADIRMGRSVALRLPEPAFPQVRLADGSGNLVALARVEGPRVHPFCVL